MELWFDSSSTENSTSCVNITIIHDNLTEVTESFDIILATNDSNVKLISPNKATVFIQDIDCESNK